MSEKPTKYEDLNNQQHTYLRYLAASMFPKLSEHDLIEIANKRKWLWIPVNFFVNQT